MQVNRILLPVDGSAHSLRAAEAALDMAKHFGSEVILLYCHRQAPVILGEPMFQGNVEKEFEKSEEIMAPFRTMFEDAGVPFQERLIAGRARDVIPDVAKVEEVGLIIMGKRGISDLARLVVGSVTNKVIQVAQCPVLVIR